MESTFLWPQTSWGTGVLDLVTRICKLEVNIPAQLRAEKSTTHYRVYFKSKNKKKQQK